MAERQFIIFKLEEEHYCADVVQVRSINDSSVLSKVPGAPGYIEGLLNLRGEIIPVINLKQRFEIEDKRGAQRILVSKSGIGFLVDDASKSVTKHEEEVLAPPELGFSDSTSYISAVVIHQERLMLVVNLDTVVSAEEIKQMMK